MSRWLVATCGTALADERIREDRTYNTNPSRPPFTMNVSPMREVMTRAWWTSPACSTTRHQEACTSTHETRMLRVP